MMHRTMFAVAMALTGLPVAMEAETRTTEGPFRKRSILGAHDPTMGENRILRSVAAQFGLTQVYQQAVHEGRSVSERDGRYAGSYDLESQIDLGVAAGLEDTKLHLLLEGGWPEAGGIDNASVGSYFGVNADAIEGEWTSLSELWLEHSVSGGSLLFRAGKIDLTGGFQCRGCEGGFDGNLYANDETGQFLNGALINNPTIAFPDNTLGLALLASPARPWHLGLAVAMRDCPEQENDLVSWGSAEEGLFAIFETSFEPKPTSDRRCGAGQYRAGMWWATQGEKAASAEASNGFYLSVSQPLPYAVGTAEGLGLFARAGWADGPGAEMESFWSVGVQCEGLWQSDDVLGLGLARGRFANAPIPNAPQGDETALELYYNLPVRDGLNLSPSVQYVADPGGAHGEDDAIVLALRLHMLFD
ncbi:MAG: carbohydrate porin [Sedimentisphaerales bacterium]|nr:carbohydrate porin [Sedimentisphaerales bacterium]